MNKAIVETFSPSQQPFIPVRHIPLKRIFDICFSIIVMILLSPLFLSIALVIRFSSRGNVFYAQERVGRGGKSFFCYKFRTMYLDADTRLERLLSDSSTMKKEWKQKRKLANDPRITPIGKFLRKTSLDELPQFWNVLKGDLSVVGPRPVVQEEIKLYYGRKAATIFSIRPGITGLWQVSGRSDTSYRRRIQLDEKYVKERSMPLDIRLIFKTVPAIFLRKGAY